MYQLSKIWLLTLLLDMWHDKSRNLPIYYEKKKRKIEEKKWRDLQNSAVHGHMQILPC